MVYLVFGALLLIAMLFCWPLWRGKQQPTATVDRGEDYNALLYRQFAAELQEDRTLDDQTRAALLADKARQLLDESPQSATASSSAEVALDRAQPRSLGLGLKTVAILVLVAGSALTYWSIGTPGAQQLVQAREILTLPTLAEVEGNAADPSISRLRVLTDSLREHVRGDPEATGSWYLLGIGELKLQSYGAASDAFERAHELVGADPNLDLYWLQARLLADQGRLSEVTRAIAQRVLGTQPNQPMVLNMLALAAYRSQDYATAVSYLNSALSNNLTDNQRVLLAEGYAQARTSLGVAGPTVDVALSLQGDPPNDAVLFVIARPVGGGVPYAVVRRPVAGVPQQVRLDDAVSMNPANPLSAAADVEIIARLSLTGRPQAGPGDWQWQSGPIRLAEAPQPVVLQAKLSTPSTGSSRPALDSDQG